MCVDVFQYSYQTVIRDSLASQRLAPLIKLSIVRRIGSSRCLRIFRVLCHLSLPDLRVARYLRWRIVWSWQSRSNLRALPSVYLPHGRYAVYDATCHLVDSELSKKFSAIYSGATT